MLEQIVWRESHHYLELKRRLHDALPEVEEAELLDTLEGATQLHEAIVEITRSALLDEAFVHALKVRVSDLETRLTRFEESADRKRRIAQQAMEEADLSKILEPDMTLSLRTNPPSLVILSEEDVPADYKLPQPPKLDRRRILDDLKNGRQIPGAVLSNSSVSLSVRTK